MRTHFTQIAQLCCTVRENNSFFEPLKAMHRATVGPKMGLRVLNITRQLFMKVETKNKKSGLHRFLTYREDFLAPKDTQRALTGPKKGRRVLKHHQTTFYEGRNKKQKILVASIFHVYTSVKGLKTGFWKKGSDPFFRISKNKKKAFKYDRGGPRDQKISLNWRKLRPVGPGQHTTNFRKCLPMRKNHLPICS